ncbi:MAG: hypothetical protein JNK60_03720 [Acidobacteria bacterium]|nr:hypothetical protein [Acidobacteriota bacterium]
MEARFQRADGTALGTRRFGLKPFEFRQADRVLEGLGEGLDNVSAVLSSEDPEARFLTFATVIDGTSGAARFVAPRQVARPDRAEPEAR